MIRLMWAYACTAILLIITSLILLLLLVSLALSPTAPTVLTFILVCSATLQPSTF